MLDEPVEPRSIGDEPPMAWGRTALHMAVGPGGASHKPKNWAMARKFIMVMLEQGADPNKLSIDNEHRQRGCTPFHTAASQGQRIRFQMLLRPTGAGQLLCRTPLTRRYPTDKSSWSCWALPLPSPTKRNALRMDFACRLAVGPQISKPNVESCEFLL